MRIDDNQGNTFNFVKESNKIEGIHRDPTLAELGEHNRFMKLLVITVKQLTEFVSVYQPNARLRNEIGLNVCVGNYIPPIGGPDILDKLTRILIYAECITPYQIHRIYENLHPFTDCNGRSGRALWAWHMVHKGEGISLGFLHHFYYQSLSEGK